MSKVKDKERILKAASEKKLVTYKESPIRLSAVFSTETSDQKRLAWNIQNDEKQGPTSEIILPIKAII